MLPDCNMNVWNQSQSPFFVSNINIETSSPLIKMFVILVASRKVKMQLSLLKYASKKYIKC